MGRNTLPPSRRPVQWNKSCNCHPGRMVHSHVDQKDVCAHCRRPISPAKMKAFKRGLAANAAAAIVAAADSAFPTPDDGSFNLVDVGELTSSPTFKPKGKGKGK